MGTRACRRESAGGEAVYCESGLWFFFSLFVVARLVWLWCVVCVKLNMGERLSERKKAKLGIVREKKDFDCESQY